MRRFLVILIISLSVNSFAQKEPKYIFYFIGDGMGPTQVRAASAYKTYKKGTDLVMLSFPVRNFVTNHAENNFITGSAAAGTALATGHKTCMKTVSMDCSKSLKLETIPEYLKKGNRKVGIITSVSIDHATPAVFYAHQKHRNDYYDIATQLAESGFDYFAGGGFLEPDEAGKPNAYDLVKKQGYTIVSGMEQLNSLNSESNKIFAPTTEVVGTKDITYVLDRPTNYPGLAEYTKAGIKMLDNEKGFFIMIEGGKIDWACHANDAASAILETIDFDNAILEAISFYNEHPDETLIIVTADHETGGLALGTSKTKYDTHFEVLDNQKISYNKFEKILEEMKLQKASFNMVKDTVEKYFSIGKNISLDTYEQTDFENAYRLSFKIDSLSKEEYSETYETYDPISVFCTQTVSKYSGIGFTTFSHTGTFIPIFAKGLGCEQFENARDNTDIAKIILKLSGKK